MAKIAIDVERALAQRRNSGGPGCTRPRVIANGEGWTVADVVCTSGPQDRPFEERHSQYTIAIVLAGSFQYRSSLGRSVMTPGSLMLGSNGQGFECGHEHGEGDRCVSFSYAPEYFERLAFEAGASARGVVFPAVRIPPVRSLSPLVAYAAAGAMGSTEVPWAEVGVKLAVHAIELAGRVSTPRRVPVNTEVRVTRAIRTIERHLDERLPLDALARRAGLSPFHFLRTFERVTGLTPHQSVRRARLREAAIRLAAGANRVLEIALDCGFGDVSNFNRAFRTEFGHSPLVLKRMGQAPRPQAVGSRT